MKGTLGISISWLYTSPDYTVYRVYKVANVNTPFVEDTSARLLHEVELKKAICGATFEPLNFRDTTTGSQPGIEVGYAIVPLDSSGDELKYTVGESGFIVTWWGDVHVSVSAQGGGGVQNVTVRLSHLVNNDLDPEYTNFTEGITDDYGHVTLPVRVQDRAWANLTQFFTLNVYKATTTAKGKVIVHTFQPSSANVSIQHLNQASPKFTDQTAVIVNGTVSHGGFDAAYFASDCPFRDGFDPFTEGIECICPVDGATLQITRASGSVENVDIASDGSFTHSVMRSENITLSLSYNGTNGTVPHSFTVSHDVVGDNVTVQEGTAPTFSYKALEDATVTFVDISTQNITAALVAGADTAPTEYVNGLPIVASVERCGWERPAWTLRGEATFSLGAAAVELRTLGLDEVLDARYYYPPPLNGDFALIGDVVDCDNLAREDIVSGYAHDATMLRGCRLKIPEIIQCNASSEEVPGCQSIRKPCGTMDKTYVDELPQIRKFAVDLSVLGANETAEPEAGRRLESTPEGNTPVRSVGRGLLIGGIYSYSYTDYTEAPTAAPTTGTAAPTAGPTRDTPVPSAAPTTAPTATPTTPAPSAAPTTAPTATPTTPAPSAAPTAGPTNAPTTPAPSAAPTAGPTPGPSAAPTAVPTAIPTSAPTVYVPPVPDVEFVITSPLCVQHVYITPCGPGANSLQSLPVWKSTSASGCKSSLGNASRIISTQVPTQPRL